MSTQEFVEEDSRVGTHQKGARDEKLRSNSKPYSCWCAEWLYNYFCCFTISHGEFRGLETKEIAKVPVTVDVPVSRRWLQPCFIGLESKRQ